MDDSQLGISAYTTNVFFLILIVSACNLMLLVCGFENVSSNLSIRQFREIKRSTLKEGFAAKGILKFNCGSD
jgi:hypothetical protein